MVKSKVLWGAERTPVCWKVDGEDRVGFDDGQSQTLSLGFGNTVPLSPFLMSGSGRVGLVLAGASP